MEIPARHGEIAEYGRVIGEPRRDQVHLRRHRDPDALEVASEQGAPSSALDFTALDVRAVSSMLRRRQQMAEVLSLRPIRGGGVS